MRLPSFVVRIGPILLCLCVLGLSVPDVLAAVTPGPTSTLGPAEPVRDGPVAGLIQYRLDVRSIERVDSDQCDLSVSLFVDLAADIIDLRGRVLVQNVREVVDVVGRLEL